LVVAAIADRLIAMLIIPDSDALTVGVQGSLKSVKAMHPAPTSTTPRLFAKADSDQNDRSIKNRDCNFQIRDCVDGKNSRRECDSRDGKQRRGGNCPKICLALHSGSPSLSYRTEKQPKTQLPPPRSKLKIRQDTLLIYIVFIDSFKLGAALARVVNL
jgi:hypothetical protein